MNICITHKNARVRIANDSTRIFASREFRETRQDRDLRNVGGGVETGRETEESRPGRLRVSVKLVVLARSLPTAAITVVTSDVAALAVSPVPTPAAWGLSRESPAIQIRSLIFIAFINWMLVLANCFCVEIRLITLTNIAIIIVGDVRGWTSLFLILNSKTFCITIVKISSE